MRRTEKDENDNDDDTKRTRKILSVRLTPTDRLSPSVVFRLS